MIFTIINIAGIVGIGIAGVMLFYAQKKAREASSLLSRSSDKWKSMKRDIETERRESLLKVKDEVYRRRNDFDMDIKRDRLELERQHSKVNNKYETLERKEEGLDNLKSELQQKERKLSRMSEILYSNEEKLKSLYSELISKLENISGFSKDQARKELADKLQGEVQLSSEKWIQKVEEEARQTAKDKAIQITVTAMQRYVAEQVSTHSSSVIQLPSDDMKGRIIGKEGRNIKALEIATGMEFIIDTPEVITVSGFNPIRREIARRSLTKLISDGRINPTRIEETVSLCEKELDEIIEEYGKQTVLDCNVQGLHPEIVTLLGKLYFRTSYSQNVLDHSKEVGFFARMIAEELGLDPNLAMRAGLLHDIGKAVTAEVEGPHALIGGDIVKRCGENPIVVNAVAAHHEEVPFTSIYGPIIVIADTMSAARPGARRETLTAYIKRLEKLEEIALSFDGIKKAYALQAGREIRIIVEEDFLDDEKAAILARNIAAKIAETMTFPGQIKVNVIREKRAIEYAR
jgi:ribonucrease Y